MARKSFVFLVMGTVIFFLCSLSSAGVPDSINYQGKLTTLTGALVNDTLQMTFSIYPDTFATTADWTETQDSVVVNWGIFHVILGSKNPIPDTVFDGSTKYLEVQVGPGPPMRPLKPMVSVAYAYKSLEADTADYARAGPGVADNDWIFRITDGADTTLMTGGEWGIARYGNVLYGSKDSTHVNLGVACTTGTSGQNNKFCTVGGGVFNTASQHGSTVGGGSLNTASLYGTVGGGGLNSALASNSTVGGGLADTASGVYSTVAGGAVNTASGGRSTVSGGQENTTSGDYSAVGGGYLNDNAGDYSVIPGGTRDTLTYTADYSMAFGGGVYVSTARKVVFFDGGYSGYLSINCDDRDGGWNTPIYVGTNSGNGNGAFLSGGGAWTSGSSRTFKQNAQPLDSEQLLAKISSLDVEAWQYKDSDERHIWPYAEDFVEAFDVGIVREDGTRENQYLSAGDVAGVALAGVKELAQQNQELRQIIEELRQRIAELEKAK